jgi:hypothetical protein
VTFIPLNEASQHNFLRKTLAFVKIDQNELSTRDVINTQMSKKLKLIFNLGTMF